MSVGEVQARMDADLRRTRMDRRGDCRRSLPDDARLDDPARLDLRHPQPWQTMTTAELIAEIGRMEKDR